MKNRIVVLCGPRLTHLNTCATLIRGGANVVGICMADQRTAGIPLNYVRNSVQRRGLWPTTSRILGRLAYMALNWRKDRAAHDRLFDRCAIEETLRPWADRIHHTDGYSTPQTIDWLTQQDADIYVAHTPYWIGKKVRNLPKTGLVLGGHPGLTPRYRGSHSAFWAIYSNRPEDVGCTVFLIDEGVDTGDIIAQERIPIEKGDSFVTLSWKGMIRIAELQARTLRDLDEGRVLTRIKTIIEPTTEFDNPTLEDFLRYRMRQSLVR